VLKNKPYFILGKKFLYDPHSNTCQNEESVRDQCIYYGQLKGGKYEGKGILISNGTYHEGIFKNGYFAYG